MDHLISSDRIQRDALCLKTLKELRFIGNNTLLILGGKALILRPFFYKVQGMVTWLLYWNVLVCVHVCVCVLCMWTHSSVEYSGIQCSYC